MRRAIGVLLMALAAVVCVILAKGYADAPGAKPPLHPEVRNPVVVELFTSEGCSDCPPAESLLSRLEQQQSVLNAQVIALEEHVDYFNNLGWADRFSSWDWTARQYAYMLAMNGDSAFTPQMIVDGREAFVGSHAWQAKRAIARAASTEKVRVSVAPSAVASDGTQQWFVKVGRLGGVSAADTPEVWLVITEDGLSSAVKDGENAGETLLHSSVVRTMRKLGAASANTESAFSGEAGVKLDTNWNRKNIRAVVFVQEQKSKHILGAATALLAP